MAKLKDVLTKSDAARRIGVSRPTIDRAVLRGELTPHQDAAGRDYLIAADVDAWALVERKPGPNPKV